MFGSRLLHLRKKHNLSQDQLADKLNINRSTYSNYELNNREPDSRTLMMIANFFDVSVDYLLGRDMGSKDGEWIFTQLDLSDDEIIENVPIVYRGRSLSEEEKREFLAIIRSILDVRQGKQ